MSHTSLHPTGTLSKFPLLLPLSRGYLLPSPLAISEHPLTHSAMPDDSPSSPPPAWPTHLLAGLKPRQYARVSINAPLSSCQGLSCQPFLQCQGLLLFPSCFPSTPTPPVPHLSPAPQPLHSPHWIQISSLSPYTQALSACFKLGTDLIPSPSTPASPTATLQAHLLHLPVH